MSVNLTFYDGVDCIGGKKILLEDGDATLFFDFGTNFKAEDMFFDEFLGPRSTFGFYDLLCLGILPPVRGLYRSDPEYPGIWDRFSSHPLYRETEVQGVLLSHAHFDHCGHFSYIREEVPIITSLTSTLICMLFRILEAVTGCRKYATQRPGNSRRACCRPQITGEPPSGSAATA